MNRPLRSIATSIMLAFPAAVTVALLPATVLAQPAVPQVNSLDAEADAGMAPGSRLGFRLTGTPRLQASVRIRGVRDSIVLRETAPGVYVGRYTLKRTDRVDAGSPVRAMLRQGNRSTASEYALGQLVAAPVAAVPQPPARPVDAFRIERFGMIPVERIEPGAELQFALDGMPGANVSVDLPGVERDVRLRETRPGHYEGSYTVRRADDIAAHRPVVATLRMGERVATAQMNIAVGRAAAEGRPTGTDNQAPNLVRLVPAEGASVPAGGQPVLISAAFDDGRGTGVDPASVRVTVSGRNLTQEAQISAGVLSLRTPLPPGRHTVEVVARDVAGNAVRKSWSFDVAAAAPASVPLRVLNFRNNDQVGAGQTTVQGSTQPNATVNVRVTAVAPAGINISQELLAHTVQADARGNFSFSFTPQFPLPGARYEINLVSIRGDLRDDERLTLVQR
ncbi:MAG: hypothetical protein JWP22_1659 [Ramlibacter sp.]|nr:hypothetical protein [Ramlibacter sp.]